MVTKGCACQCFKLYLRPTKLVLCLRICVASQVTHLLAKIPPPKPFGAVCFGWPVALYHGLVLVMIKLTLLLTESKRVKLLGLPVSSGHWCSCQGFQRFCHNIDSLYVNGLGGWRPYSSHTGHTMSYILVTLCLTYWSYYVLHTGHTMSYILVILCLTYWSYYVLHTGHTMSYILVTLCLTYWSYYVLRTGHTMSYVLVTLCITYWSHYVLRTGHTMSYVLVILCLTYWSYYVLRTGHTMSYVLVILCLTYWSYYVLRTGHTMSYVLVTLCLTYWSHYVLHTGHTMSYVLYVLHTLIMLLIIFVPVIFRTSVFVSEPSYIFCC